MSLSDSGLGPRRKWAEQIQFLHFIIIHQPQFSFGGVSCELLTTAAEWPCHMSGGATALSLILFTQRVTYPQHPSCCHMLGLSCASFIAFTPLTDIKNWDCFSRGLVNVGYWHCIAWPGRRRCMVFGCMILKQQCHWMWNFLKMEEAQAQQQRLFFC